MKARPFIRPFLVLLAISIGPSAHAFQWPWGRNDPWPSSSRFPVVPLGHPTVESIFERVSPDSAYRFVVFGDQRALARGEWQEMIERIVDQDRERPVAFVVDTGDIVSNGKHSDQFRLLAEILSPLRRQAYLVGFGNHELDNNRDRIAREHTVQFLRHLSSDISPDRVYYRKDVGAASFLFLDSNDWVYGENGERKTCPPSLDPESRGSDQVEWLRRQFEDLDATQRGLRIAVLHHPFVQSSEKHRKTARSLWNLRAGERLLVDVLADGGVDVVLTGHTHTYERFRLVREDGHVMSVVNVSGRPRDSFLWIGSGDRRARDIRGREREFFGESGWMAQDRWTITQEDVMLKDEEGNQFALVTVEPDGRLFCEIHFLDDDAPGGTRRSESVRLH